MTFTWRGVHDLLAEHGLAWPQELLDAGGPGPRYNIAPTSTVPVLLALAQTPGVAVVRPMRWWLTPHWAKDAKPSYAMFNARSETAASKPAFRGPMKDRRCVVPASAYYEWQAPADGGTKKPYAISRADGQPLLLAGLWDRWHDELESCAILTTAAEGPLAAIHDRTPCVLEPHEVAAWLHPAQHDAARVQPLLRPPAAGVLAFHRVSTRVGNARVDEPSLLDPVADVA